MTPRQQGSRQRNLGRQAAYAPAAAERAEEVGRDRQSSNTYSVALLLRLRRVSIALSGICLLHMSGLDRHFESWEEFQKFASRHEARKAYEEIWFRGQSDAEWPLSTSLERRSQTLVAAPFSVAHQYLQLICRIQPAIETFTGNLFSAPDLTAIYEAKEYRFFWQKLHECAPYLVHLRHGGFPSPLLDWTVSPYVAAYFAFRNARHDGNVAVYVYREWAAEDSTPPPDGPRIVAFDSSIRTHKRHFRQQARYTACVVRDWTWSFAPHESVSEQKHDLHGHLLFKITIPATERLKVLRFCDSVNLNEFTLFDNEEGLLEMQALRSFDLFYGQ